MNSEQTIESPCVGVCDTGGTDLCHGCFRSLDEIGAWSLADDAQKREIIQRAQQRRAASSIISDNK